MNEKKFCSREISCQMVKFQNGLRIFEPGTKCIIGKVGNCLKTQIWVLYRQRSSISTSSSRENFLLLIISFCSLLWHALLSTCYDMLQCGGWASIRPLETLTTLYDALCLLWTPPALFQSSFGKPLRQSTLCNLQLSGVEWCPNVCSVPLEILKGWLNRPKFHPEGVAPIVPVRSVRTSPHRLLSLSCELVLDLPGTNYSFGIKWWMDN